MVVIQLKNKWLIVYDSWEPSFRVNRGKSSWQETTHYEQIKVGTTIYRDTQHT